MPTTAAPKQVIAKVIRDRQAYPLTREFSEAYFQHFKRKRDVLAAGWETHGGRRDLLLAAVGNTLDFSTWRSLVREQGLNVEQATELMTRMVRCVVCY